jgi:hypothetical protein
MYTLVQIWVGAVIDTTTTATGFTACGLRIQWPAKIILQPVQPVSARYIYIYIYIIYIYIYIYIHIYIIIIIIIIITITVLDAFNHCHPYPPQNPGSFVKQTN